MTIETRMSFPEGGAECPPDDNPLPGCSTATSPTSSDISTGDTCVTTLPTTNGSNKSKRATSNSQRCKLRSHYKTIPMQFSKCEDSSENILKAITANLNDMDKGHGCTNDISFTGEETTDLKKPTKMKPMSSDGTKEEAASRKSMRLRMRRGKTDNSDDFFGPKERPRYVEDLTSIDFDDEKLKIMFMDALGMSLKTKRAKVETSSESASSSLCFNLQRNQKVLESDSEEKVGCKVNETVGATSNGTNFSVLPKSHVADQPKITSASIILSNLNTSNRSHLTALVNQHKSINHDDDDGWECWVKRLSGFYKAKPANTSPTKKEINESLIRLVRLGTAVKVVGSGLS